MKLGMEVGLGSATVFYGDQLPKGARNTPQYSSHVCCGQTTGWMKMPLGTKVGSAHATVPPIKGQTLQFSAHVYCGQTVAHLSYC